MQTENKNKKKDQKTTKSTKKAAKKAPAPSRVKQKLLRKIARSEHNRAKENRALANYKRRMKNLERKETNKQNLKELNVLFKSYKVPKRDKNGKMAQKKDKKGVYHTVKVSAPTVHELMKAYTLVSNEKYTDLLEIYKLVCKIYKPTSKNRDEGFDELIKGLNNSLEASKAFQ